MIGGGKSIVVFELITDLAFVSHHFVARNAAKENPGIHFRRSQFVFGQQNKITIRFFAFQLGSAAFDMKGSIVVDGELARHLGILGPLLQVFVQ